MSYNKSYHRFFEGYVEKKEEDPRTGRLYIKRIYAGDYYLPQLDERGWKRTKITYVMIYVWSVIALIMQGVGQSAKQWYVVVPVLLGLIVEVWLGVYVFAYATHPRKLNIREYRDREILKSMSMGGALVFGLLLIGQVAWMILNRQFYWYWMICVLADVAAMAALRYLFCRERDMDYVKEENKVKVDDDSYDIRYRQLEES